MNKDWRSRWFADKRSFGKLLKEDIEIPEEEEDKRKAAKELGITHQTLYNKIAEFGLGSDGE